MLQNNKINIVYRVICLITFIVVLVLTSNFITLSLLTIAYYLFTRNDKKREIFCWYIVTILSYIISYLMNDFIFLRIVLIIGYGYYFLNSNSGIDNFSNNEIINIDKYVIRFAKNNKKRKDVIDDNLLNAVYLTVHLVVLFIAILVG